MWSCDPPFVLGVSWDGDDTQFSSNSTPAGTVSGGEIHILQNRDDAEEP